MATQILSDEKIRQVVADLANPSSALRNADRHQRIFDTDEGGIRVFIAYDATQDFYYVSYTGKTVAVYLDKIKSKNAKRPKNRWEAAVRNGDDIYFYVVSSVEKGKNLAERGRIAKMIPSGKLMNYQKSQGLFIPEEVYKQYQAGTISAEEAIHAAAQR